MVRAKWWNSMSRKALDDVGCMDWSDRNVTQLGLRRAIQNMDYSDGRRLSLYQWYISAQTCHNNFSIRKNASPEYFVLVGGYDEGRLYVCKRFHHFIFYPREALLKMADLFVSEPVLLFPTQRFCWTLLSSLSMCWAYTIYQLALTCISVPGGLRHSRVSFVCVRMEPQNFQLKHSGRRICARRWGISFRDGTRRLATLHNIFMAGSWI